MKHIHPDNAIIDAFGGTVALARVCECKPQAVSRWRRAGIPKARRQFLKLLRPDLFRPTPFAGEGRTTSVPSEAQHPEGSRPHA